MHAITCYLDFVSPYAWLAFDGLPRALEGISHVTTYRPVLLGALLKHHGHEGPVGIAPKRVWTYRHVQWLGHAQGVALQMPAQHPFNPLPLLRLALACANEDGAVSRHVAGTLLRHVWAGGGDANDPARLAALGAQLKPVRNAGDDAVKAMLRTATDRALALGVFGVPAFVVDDRVFWGLDALPMLRAYLQGDPWFADGGAWDTARDKAAP